MHYVDSLISSPKKMFLFFAVIISFVYMITFNNPYFLDDTHTIQNNNAIHLTQNFFKLWTSAKYYSSTPDNFGYRPVTTMSNAILWQVGQGETWPFHLSKKLMHALICVLMFLIWRRLFANERLMGHKVANADRWSFFMAALFAVHPVNTQVVNYISASSSMLAGLFFLLGFLTYLKYRDDEKNKYLVHMFIYYVLSILSKEEGITLPAVILAFELLMTARGEKFPLKRLVKTVGTYVLGAAFSVGLLMHMFEATSDIARGTLPRMMYFMTQWRAWLRYMKLAIFPDDLNADNLEFGFSTVFMDGSVIIALALNLGLIIFSLVKLRKTALFALGLAWFYIGISPASSIVVLAEPVNDHRMYLAFLGFFPMVFYVVGKFLMEKVIPKIRMQQAVAAVLASVFVLYSGWTMARNVDWQSNETIWEDTVRKNPHSGRALNNLSLEYMARADWMSSIRMLSKCLDLFPCYMECWVNKAIVLTQMGHEDQAQDAYTQAMRCDQTGIGGTSFLADFLARRGRNKEALIYYERAAEASFKRNLTIMISYIETLVAVGDITKARKNIVELEQAFPNHPEVLALIERYGR